MVYESDFYTTRRPYSSRPYVSSYSVTTPRHYVVRDYPGMRTAEEQYSYSYTNSSSSNTASSSDPYSRPQRQSYTTESTTRREAGPYGNYSTERSSRTSTGGPGGYRSSYETTTSGRLPGGTSYRHFSYRV